MLSAAKWLQEHGSQHESFMLFVDEFDPHEPFDTPEPWANKYDQEWSDELIIWPPYAIGGIERGIITERQGNHIRANYGSKLSMIDHWFGKLLDAMDEKSMWEDTLFILCTDHGHYLGERDLWGKPAVPQYETLGHTPLMISCPGVAAGTTDALTTNVDIHATLMDLFDCESHYLSHGQSMLPLLRGETESIREWAVGGVFGRWVQIQHGTHKYARSSVDTGFPLSMWSNRWSTMPVTAMPRLRLPNPDHRAWLDFMPESDIPVIRQPFVEGDLLPYWSMNPPVDEHYLFDISQDPAEENNLVGRKAENYLQEVLHAALKELQAPDEQFARLGLA
jgi:arylsulfatase A-like enzyme